MRLSMLIRMTGNFPNANSKKKSCDEKLLSNISVYVVGWGDNFAIILAPTQPSCNHRGL